MNYSVVQPTRVDPQPRAARPSRRQRSWSSYTARHTGTSIRRMFQSQGTWQLLRIVCHGRMQSNVLCAATRPRLDICFFSFLPYLSAKVCEHDQRIAKNIGYCRPLTTPCHVVHCVASIDLILSEHNFFGRHAFSHSEWVRHIQKISSTVRTTSICGAGRITTRSSRGWRAYREGCLHALEPLITWLSLKASSMQWIAELAKVPDDHRNATGFGHSWRFRFRMLHAVLPAAAPMAILYCDGTTRASRSANCENCGAKTAAQCAFMRQSEQPGTREHER